MKEQKPWQEMTMSEQMSAERDRLASFRLEHEVRAAARARGLESKAVGELVEKARASFVFVNGEPQAVHAARDGKREPVRRDGGLVTVDEWVTANVPGKEPSAIGTFGPSPVSIPEKVKHPFKSETWNLTLDRSISTRDYPPLYPHLQGRLQFRPNAIL